MRQQILPDGIMVAVHGLVWWPTLLLAKHWSIPQSLAPLIVGIISFPSFHVFLFFLSTFSKALEHTLMLCTPNLWHYFFSIIPCISVFIFFFIFFKALEHSLILCTSSWNNFFSCPFLEHLLSIFFKPLKHHSLSLLGHFC